MGQSSGCEAVGRLLPGRPYDPRMAETSGREEPARPTVVLFVYSWDLLLAILAVFGALAPFAGGVPSTSGSTHQVPLPVQILAALSSAAYAAVLIMVASLLTRRRRWVRLMQMLVMAVAIPLAAISVLVLWVIGAALPLASVLIAILFILVDTLTIVLMTERRVVEWYAEPGTPPRYVSGTLAFWALSGCAVIAFQAALR
jgi:hypothetical protein